MPLITDDKGAQALRTAGRLSGMDRPAAAQPAPPAPPAAPSADLLASLGATFDKLAALNSEQLAGVLAVLAASSKQNEQVLAAIQSIAAQPAPRAPQKWRVTVTKRDRAGAIEDLLIKQVEDGH